MHQFFTQDTRKQKIYVLYGLGGAGKTQIALKFIEESTCFTDQLLVDASNTDTIETGLKNIAAMKQAGTASQDTLALLASKHEQWLLFLDNADDPKVNLNQFFPRCNHGNIIITSRNHGVRIHGAHCEVSNMEELDAVTLLLKSAQCEASATNKILAAEIVKALCFFPLAIVQAGAFISESETLGTYLDLFLKNQTELLKKKSVQTYDNYAWAVYTTWEMSFSQLSRPAAMFLQLCSFLHPDDIFEEIFTRAANYAMKLSNQPGSTELLQTQNQSSSDNDVIELREFLSCFIGPTGDWNSLRFLNLTNEIKAYSLISYNEERKSFSIHPLVHSWSRTTLSNPQAYHSCVGEILGISILEIPHQNMMLESLRLVSHVDSLMQAWQSTHFQKQYALIYLSQKSYFACNGLMRLEVLKWLDRAYEPLAERLVIHCRPFQFPSRSTMA
ncbi:P-loop containing nucleoside triphosphate hydrolase protein [Mycena sanguinolenta]|nr:P-loop containing nucleoside triphosphate hydrolase protein [Mycena sanguinolenta]KAJ6450529.1 P-loop containing nucleoside triphosphate hydrolase protein [Mycena sanguinolenta]